MKHIQLFEHFAENIVEGVNFNGSVDADLAIIGTYFTEDQSLDDKEYEKLTLEAFKKTKPFALTGNIKTDGAKLIKYLVDAFKRVGVELEENNAIVYSPNFTNEIEIPVAGTDGIFFQTYLDYTELAANGSNFTLSGDFASEGEGSLDFFVDDIGNNGAIVKSATGFKKYLETLNSEKQ